MKLKKKCKFDNKISKPIAIVLFENSKHGFSLF